MNWIKKFFIENKCLIIRLYKNILSSSSNHHSFTIAKKISMKIVLLFLSSNTFCVIPLNPLPNADWYCQHFLIQNIIFQDWKLFLGNLCIIIFSNFYDNVTTLFGNAWNIIWSIHLFCLSSVAWGKDLKIYFGAHSLKALTTSHNRQNERTQE